MFITKKHLSRRAFLRGWGSRWRCRCWIPWFRRRRRSARPPRSRRPALGFVYIPHGAIMDQWTPGHRRQGLRVHAHPEAAGTVRRVRQRGQRAGASRRGFDRGAFAQPDNLAERRPAQAHPRRGRIRRRDRGSDRGAAHRPGHHAAVAGAGHRGPFRADRRLRPRLRLHLHEHALLAHAHHAAAHGDQSAQGLRAHVRPGRQRRGALGAGPGRAQHSGRHHAAGLRFAAYSGRAGPLHHERLSGERSRNRAAHSEGRRASRAQPICPRLPRAFRSTSSSTST